MVFNWCNRWFICHIIRNWFVSCCHWDCHMICCAIWICHCYWYIYCAWYVTFGKLPGLSTVTVPGVLLHLLHHLLLFLRRMVFNWCNRWFICHIIRNWFLSCCYWHCNVICCAIWICHCYWYVYCAWYVTFW